MNKEYLTAMGIPVWTTRAARAPVMPTSCHLNALQTAVANCTACPLHRTRTQTVFGIGNPSADIMFIGEAPGFHEDQQGEPFVGQAGLLLTAMLHALDLDRQTVYIANILKCHPPQNRDPLPAEISTCTPFLDKQIAAIQPKLLVALGRVAAHYLLKTDMPLGEMRGKWHSYTDIPLLVTFHPAYLLRNPQDKRHALHDLQQLQMRRNHLLSEQN